MYILFERKNMLPSEFYKMHPGERKIVYAMVVCTLDDEQAERDRREKEQARLNR